MAVKYDVDPDLARKIIACESSRKPYAINHNKNGTTDYSFWQINSIHAKEAWVNSLDITNPLDNLEYGFVLLSKEGVSPWSASQACWSKA